MIGNCLPFTTYDALINIVFPESDMYKNEYC